jgi:hypothetical protein
MENTHKGIFTNAKIEPSHATVPLKSVSGQKGPETQRTKCFDFVTKQIPPFPAAKGAV